MTNSRHSTFRSKPVGVGWVSFFLKIVTKNSCKQRLF